ncbi:MAG: hypothetical protein AAGI03_09320 [Pseudomonadota bacterium]
MKEGFDPAVVEDPIWFANPETGTYEQLTPEAHEKIVSGAFKF